MSPLLRSLAAAAIAMTPSLATYVVEDDTIHAAVDAYLSRMRSGTLDGNTNEEDDIASWDTSRVTSMALLFEGATDFNADISGWNTAKLVDMRRMFKSCSSFNQDVNGWIVSAVTDMSDLFNGATLFDHELGAWDTSSVTSMARMFMNSRLFSKVLANFTTSRVVDMSQMFMGAPMFSGGDLNSWDVTAVTSMHSMFEGATTFNGNISKWDVRLCSSTARMFADAISFRGDLTQWELESVEMMGGMFHGALQYSETLCWESLDIVNVVDASDAFCDTQGAGLDPCCVDPYLVDQSCCSTGSGVCQSVCLVQEPAENEGEEEAMVFDIGGQNDNLGAQDTSNGAEVISLEQVTVMPSAAEGKNVTSVPSQSPLPNSQVTAPPTILSSMTSDPRSSPPTTTVPSAAKPTMGAPALGENNTSTEGPSDATDDFFLQRPDTDDSFLVDGEGATEEDVVEQQPIVEEYVEAETDYVDGGNVATGAEEIAEANEVADSGLVVITAFFLVLIFFMLIVFVAGTWQMQQTSFPGIPHAGL